LSGQVHAHQELGVALGAGHAVGQQFHGQARSELEEAYVIKVDVVDGVFLQVTTEPEVINQYEELLASDRHDESVSPHFSKSAWTATSLLGCNGSA
jgi:hypothetical protein